MDEASKILEAIGALGEKVEGVRTDIAGLKKTDEHLTEEVQRLGQEQKALRKDVDELRNETRRTFDTEREAAKATNEAMIRHVNDAAKAFHQKADKIDAVEEETKKQSAELAKQTAILTRLDAIAANPMVRRVAYVIGLVILAWAAKQGFLK